MPSPLPPRLKLSWVLLEAVVAAERAVANLNGVGRTLPYPHLLIQPFARRERNKVYMARKILALTE